jgi:hypothetical protein
VNVFYFMGFAGLTLAVLHVIAVTEDWINWDSHGARVLRGVTYLLMLSFLSMALFVTAGYKFPTRNVRDYAVCAVNWIRYDGRTWEQARWDYIRAHHEAAARELETACASGQKVISGSTIGNAAICDWARGSAQVVTEMPARPEFVCSMLADRVGR